MGRFVAAESVPYELSLRVITKFPRSEEFQLTCTSQPGLKEGYYAHARKVADVNCKRELIVYLRESSKTWAQRLRHEYGILIRYY